MCPDYISTHCIMNLINYLDGQFLIFIITANLVNNSWLHLYLLIQVRGKIGNFINGVFSVFQGMSGYQIGISLSEEEFGLVKIVCVTAVIG